MSGGTLHIERQRGCVTLRLDNVAKRNSLDLPMLKALQAAASDLVADRELQLVILRGAGNAAFCAGADFDAMTVAPIAHSVMEMEHALESAVAALATIEVPVIAAIEGACFGGGLQLALSADIRIANAAAQFGIPAAHMGIAYPFHAITRICAAAGLGATQLMLLGGESFDAALALQRRLIDEVVPDAQFEARLAQLCAALMACPRASAVAYKCMVQMIAQGDCNGARTVHAGLADAALFLPKLEAIVNRRRLRLEEKRAGAQSE